VGKEARKKRTAVLQELLCHVLVEPSFGPLLGHPLDGGLAIPQFHLCWSKRRNTVVVQLALHCAPKETNFAAFAVPAHSQNDQEYR
jgi:hypothetical protein